MPDVLSAGSSLPSLHSSNRSRATPVHLVVGDVQEEAVGLGDAGRREPLGDVTGAEPGAVRAVEVHRDVGQPGEDMHCVVQHVEPVGCGSGGIGIGRLAPLERVRAVGAAVRVVERDDPQSVRLEDHDRRRVPDAGREAVDPRLVLGGRGRSAG
jgi:hypothetical protein